MVLGVFKRCDTFLNNLKMELVSFIIHIAVYNYFSVWLPEKQYCFNHFNIKETHILFKTVWEHTFFFFLTKKLWLHPSTSRADFFVTTERQTHFCWQQWTLLKKHIENVLLHIFGGAKMFNKLTHQRIQHTLKLVWSLQVNIAHYAIFQ